VASRLKCECGYAISINSFEGHGICRLISDNQVDSIEGSISADDLVRLWFSSPEMIKCGGCDSFYSWDKNIKEYVQYKRTNT